MFATPLNIEINLNMVQRGLTMIVEVPYGKDIFRLDLPVPEKRVVVAKAKAEVSSEPIEVQAKVALENPIGAKRIQDNDLKGKKVAILVDDKTRPTPANLLAPLVLDELKKAGASDENIFFIIACGLHTPNMPLPIVTAEQQIENKLGRELADKYKVVTNDGYNWDKQQFIGFSNFGTPLWINKEVANADYKVAIGRICPHSDPGYEGGGKIIVPGVASMETVVQNHRMNCSPSGGAGTLDENPTRRDMDELGKMAKLDFILNMISKPGRGAGTDKMWNNGFAGDSILAHRCGIEFGDKTVWGAEIGKKQISR